MPFISSLNTLYYRFPSEIVRQPNISQVQDLSNNKHKHLYSDLLLKPKSTCTSRNLVLATESVYRFSKIQENQSQLFQELLDKYWRQTIFFSNASPIARKYSALLAKQDDILAKNRKKVLMSNVSKALQKGTIDADLDNISQKKIDVPTAAIRYIWGKSINIGFPKYLDGLWVNRRLINTSSNLQRTLTNNLYNNNFPIFVVTNSSNQIVVTEPSSQIIHQNNIFHKAYLWYYDRFLWKQDNNSVYEGWFFVNPKDAEEYANFIKSRYPRSAHQNGLGILPTTLKTYYSLNRSAPPRTEFRLFPDLEEVGRLVVSSKHRRGLAFDKNQNYSNKYFQGQPVYFIKSVLCNDRNTGLKNDVSYYYQIPGDLSGQKYIGVFFNKTVAINAWQNFRLLNPSLKLPMQPKLDVYNLEDFLKDYEDNSQLQGKNFLFIPSEDTYEYVKSLSLNQFCNQNILFKQFTLYRFGVSLWIQRLIWSLTSGQPPN
uniref:Conserved_ORF_2 protein n=1 Tax=Titanophycus setchellii TaxID=940129 RepID=A0A1G4NY32_9FLOR|nr:hypothetical protein P8471_pgp148 [Titanophycus setchellii]SCW23562.1 conserved_ORF_2 [Titanophycus setchellii]